MWPKVLLKERELTTMRLTLHCLKNYSFGIIMAFVAYFNLELHQMEVKRTFLNGNLEEDLYMEQPEWFIKWNNNQLVCKLKKSIYGLKQAT